MAGRDLSWFFNVGTTGGFGKRYHVPGMIGSGFNNGFAAATYPANTIIAVPWNTGRGYVLAEMGLWVFSVTTAAQFRVGVYANLTGNQYDLYPGALLFDSGNINATPTATMRLHTLSPALTLAQRTHVWLAMIIDGSASISETERALTGHNHMGSTIGGSDAKVNHVRHLRGVSPGTYGALPDPFPTTSPTVAQGAPSIYCYFSGFAP